MYSLVFILTNVCNQIGFNSGGMSVKFLINDRLIVCLDKYGLCSVLFCAVDDMM